MKIVLGIIVVAAGVFAVIKTEWLLENFGRIDWFDEKLGSEGGSRLGYKLVGLLFIFIGLLLVFRLEGGFMAWLTSPLVGKMGGTLRLHSEPGKGSEFSFIARFGLAASAPADCPPPALQGKSILVDFVNTTVPKNLVRRLDVGDFGTPIRIGKTVIELRS